MELNKQNFWNVSTQAVVQVNTLKLAKLYFDSETDEKKF